MPPLRLRITLHSQARLPLAYREGLQAAIYRLLPQDLSQWLHDEGLLVEGKPMKLFVFSRLQGLSYLAQEKAFVAQGEVGLLFATALEEVAQALVNTLWAKGGLELYGHPLRLVGLESLPLPPERETLTVSAQAPITAYRTVGGRTVYLNPLNREFGEVLAENLNRKARALGLEEGTLEVQPLGFRPEHKKLERYKGTWVEGWMGLYRLRGTPHLLRLALLTGLGAKNSQGFGFVKEVS